MKNPTHDKHIQVAMVATLLAILASFPCILIFILSKM